MQIRSYLLLFILLIFASCQQDLLDLSVFDLQEGEIQMKYDETQCSDPWQVTAEIDYGGSEAERINKLLNYLQGEGVDVIAVQYDFNEENVIACLECHCLSGGIYYLKVKDVSSTIEKLNQLGFELL